MVNIAIFASGNGSNFSAITKYFKNNKDIHIKILICNKKDAYVLERAKNLNIPYLLVNYKKDGQENVEQQILNKIQEEKINLIVLAGYMKILSKKFIENCNIPILNIHPSLLPKFKGINGIKQAFNSNDSETGITIHYVNEFVDEGEIIFQKKVKINRKKGLEDLENRIHNLEHKWYPKVIEKIAKQLLKKINCKENV